MNRIFFCLILISFLTTGFDNFQKIEGKYVNTFSTQHLGWRFELELKSKNKFKEVIYVTSAINGKIRKKKHKINGKWKIENDEIVLIPSKCSGDKSYCTSDTLLIINQNQLKIKTGTAIYQKE